ncbi:MAG: hypothetical protein ACOX2F_11340 [bacterium]
MNLKIVKVLFVLILAFNLSAEQNQPIPPTVVLPENYEELVKNFSCNIMEKRVNAIVGQAVSKQKVVLEKVNEIIYLQVIPNFAYLGEVGEEKLGEDLIAILESNKMEAPRSAQFMSLDYRELMAMNLPFKKRLIDSMVIGADKFNSAIDLTFFINMNALTNSVFGSLKNIKEFNAIYNSQERYYRTKFEGSALLFLIRIPNIAYQLAYTGELFENIVSSHIKEALFLKNVMKDYEKLIEKDKELSFDGRYIKGKNISIDLWFLANETEMDLEKGKAVIQKALKKEAIELMGSEKKKKKGTK